MSTAYPEVFANLAGPFEREEVKSRTASGGRVLHYVTARSVMNRLDEVVGPENWWDDYEFFGQSGCKCHLTLRLADGRTVTKVGVGGVTPMPDESDTDKTGESDAFKRAAAKFGVGRYLYGDGTPRFVQVARLGAPAAEPEQPAPVAAEKPREKSEVLVDKSRVLAGPRPRTGRALFGWIRDQERAAGVRLLPFVVEWGKANGLPERLLDWDTDQVRLACREVRLRLDAEGRSSGHVADQRLSTSAERN